MELMPLNYAFPRPVKIHELVTRKTITSYRTVVYHIQGIGDWTAPIRCWFSTDPNGALRFITKPIEGNIRSSKPIHTLEDLVRIVNHRLHAIDRIDGTLFNAHHDLDFFTADNPTIPRVLSYDPSDDLANIRKYFIKNCSIKLSKALLHVNQHSETGA